MKGHEVDSVSKQEQVRIWVADVDIPTYGIGKPDKNPMFLEKRVYQGSSGKVYPYPVIDKIENEKKMQSYKIVFLENEFLHIEIIPELGGRIYRALDRTNNYDFVYYNRVIKPALVGLTGPWISGGIEFNWPQHHRPNTYGPVEYTIKDNEDGSQTVWVSEIDRMYGTKGVAGFTLYPGKAYLEISGQLYNRTPHPQTFLWWANPAIAVNDHTQSVFPPDVHAVFDHGKRDVSRFPIATGTYYKMDYSAGVDISRYKNIPVPTSYMAYHSDYNFVGGYDHSARAGILHVANHHISPGKKQWTWGNGDFGAAWDRNLTDEDGPYIELMTGVYTDNQPDFTWLQPFEEKTFKQYFMPYKQIGMIKNATIDAAVNLEVDGQTADIQIYATSNFEKAFVELTSATKSYFLEEVTLSPVQIFTVQVNLGFEVQAHELTLTVKTIDGKELVTYQPQKKQIEQVPEAAKAIGAPEELKSTEALYLAAMHLEQYRHATYEPDAYYLEGLKRDPGDIRLNNAFGSLLLRKGLFQESETCFCKAIATATRHNTNPYDSEPHYNLGLALKLQGRLDEAFDAFYKATWSAAWQDKSFYFLAQIACAKGDLDDALELVEKSIMKNYRNCCARNLKTAILRQMGKHRAAEQLAMETISFDLTDFGAWNELASISHESGDANKAAEILLKLSALMRNDPHNYIALAQEYAESGLYTDAIDVLKRITQEATSEVYPMVYYYLGNYEQMRGCASAAQQYLLLGQAACSDYCFPNQLSDLVVLTHVIQNQPSDAKAHYYLGNLLYDKKRHLDAIAHWEESVSLDSNYPTAHRNLALAYYNKLNDADKALKSLEIAFHLNEQDARVYYELDQLYKKLSRGTQERLRHLEQNLDLVLFRDDLYIEYVTILNMLGDFSQAKELIASRKFHPWEGGEGKVSSQYVLCHVELAKKQLLAGEYGQAIQLLEKAKQYPENIGEGKLTGAQENHINYYLGLAYTELGQKIQAKDAFGRGSQGLDEPTSAMFYNDQPPEMIFYQGMCLLELGREEKARGKFNKLVDYGEKHLFKPLQIDFFAVSLPDFLVFDEDMNRKNEIHCRYMTALGYLGLSKVDHAEEQFRHVLQLDPSHQGAIIHLPLCK
jgi:tetratricopeptide (TPR) repeat protein